jgi:hypothetical protein
LTIDAGSSGSAGIGIRAFTFGVTMAQNTLAEISSGLIREWRTYWARECITA